MLDWVTNHPRSKVPSLRHTFFASPLCLPAEWSMSCLCSSILQVSLPAAGFHQEIGAPICLHYTNTAHNVLGPFSTSEWMRRHNFRERVQPDSAGAFTSPAWLCCSEALASLQSVLQSWDHIPRIFSDNDRQLWCLQASTISKCASWFYSSLTQVKNPTETRVKKKQDWQLSSQWSI